MFWDAGSHPSLKFTAYLFSAKVASFFVRHFLVTGSHRATGPDGDAACEEEGGCHGCPRGRRPRERTVLRAGLGPRAPSSPAARLPPFLPLSGAQGLIRLKTMTARGDSSCTDKSATLTGPGRQGTRPGGTRLAGDRAGRRLGQRSSCWGLHGSLFGRNARKAGGSQSLWSSVTQRGSVP